MYLITIVHTYAGTVVRDQPERKFTSVAEQIHPHITGKRSIVYLDAAKHVPWLAIALRSLGLKTCAYYGKPMTIETDVMVSTLAFGMGINWKDVIWWSRLVRHKHLRI